jgi:hypothetical protein
MVGYFAERPAVIALMLDALREVARWRDEVNPDSRGDDPLDDNSGLAHFLTDRLPPMLRGTTDPGPRA